MVSLATFGTMNGKIFAASRLTHAAAERKYLPAALRKLNAPKLVKWNETSQLERGSQGTQDKGSLVLAKEGLVPV